MNLGNIINKTLKRYFLRRPIQKCMNRQIYENNDNVKRYIDLQRNYLRENSNSLVVKDHWENYYKFLDNY